MPRLDDCRDDLIAALAAHRAPPPARGPDGGEPLRGFERLARVALGLVATPKAADAAWEALRDAGMLDPATLGGAHPLELDDILKQARVAMAIKSIRPLQNLARWVVGRGADVTPEGMAGLATDSIRDEWRGINGLGLASVDSLLLHGLGRPSYPVDRASYRILVRHGWLDPTADYDEARGVLERLVAAGLDEGAGRDVDGEAATRLLVELREGFGRTGRDYCKPSQVRCERCPLRPWLPPSGPIEVD